jgi:hypothetical protein
MGHRNWHIHEINSYNPKWFVAAFEQMITLCSIEELHLMSICQEEKMLLMTNVLFNHPTPRCKQRKRIKDKTFGSHQLVAIFFLPLCKKVKEEIKLEQ